MLYEMLYVSYAPNGMDRDALLALLKVARENNAKHGITGLLAYHQRELMQLIEGERADVEQLFSNIVNDSRHQQVKKLHEGTISARGFSEWRMGFVAPDEDALRDRPAYVLLTSQGLRGASGESQGRRLLMQLSRDFLGR